MESIKNRLFDISIMIRAICIILMRPIRYKLNLCVNFGCRNEIKYDVNATYGTRIIKCKACSEHKDMLDIITDLSDIRDIRVEDVLTKDKDNITCFSNPHKQERMIASVFHKQEQDIKYNKRKIIYLIPNAIAIFQAISMLEKGTIVDKIVAVFVVVICIFIRF